MNYQSGVELQHNHSGQFPCPACEQFRASTLLSSALPFSVASELWLRSHAAYIKPSSLRVYEQHRKALASFFQDIPLDQLHIGNIRAYQEHRKATVCAEMINAEIGNILIPILAEVERWQFLVRVYKPLPVTRRRVRQSMTEDEMRRLITIALDASKPRRLLAGHCLLVMANTGMGFGELRHLHRADVFLNVESPYVTVTDGLKNSLRARVLPLNWIALRSMRWIIHRWEDLGGSQPEQFILPHAGHREPGVRKRKSQPIFNQPMAIIWNAARKILNEAGLNHLDIYDMRSHFATKIMENPDISESEAGEYIGHSKVAREMNRRYFAPKMKKMIKAVDKVAVDPSPTLKLLAFPGGRK